MSPVDHAGPVTGMNFALASYEKFQPGFRDEKRPKFLGTSSGAKFEKQSKHAWRNTRIITFAFENFTMDLEARRELGNRASPVKRAHVKRLPVSCVTFKWAIVFK